MELFGSTTSPFVRHCQIAFMQQNLPFQLKIVDYATTATDTPVQKMPYLKDETVQLTDSTSIIAHGRASGTSQFPQSITDLELYTLASTLIDTGVNLFLLEKEGITPEKSPYLARQYSRLGTGFAALDSMIQPAQAMKTDGHIRTACLVDWINFRARYDMSSYLNLAKLLETANSDPHFTKTNPRG